jgi:hypothetical protein
MNETVRARFWLDAALASTAAVLAALTVFWRDWLEFVTGLDPDRHSGALEWAIAAGFVAVALVACSAARHEWRRVTPVPR